MSYARSFIYLLALAFSGELALASSASPSSKSHGLDRCEHQLRPYKNVTEILAGEYLQQTKNRDRRLLPGRFFHVTSRAKNSESLMWLIPFAEGEACIVREVVAVRTRRPSS